MNTEEWDYITRAGMEYEINTIRSQLEEARREAGENYDRWFDSNMRCDELLRKKGAMLSENAALKKEVEELKETNRVINNYCARLEGRIRELKAMVMDCRVQLEYLNEKFGETGTTNKVLSMIKTLVP